MDIDRSLALAEVVRRLPSVSMIGMHMHLGSQITTAEPYAGAVAKGVELIARLRAMGHPIAWYNMGGGFGINYRRHEARPIDEFAAAIVPGVKATGCRLALEPGRFIAGNAGILVSRVLYTKQSGEKRFLIQDAAMNDLIRPALYDSFHRIWPVAVPAGLPAPPDDFEAAIPGTEPWDVVGPVCESGDFLAKDRALPADRPRRPAGHVLGRGLRHGHGLELQHPPPRRRGARRRGRRPPGPPPRDVRGPGPARAGRGLAGRS